MCFRYCKQTDRRHKFKYILLRITYPFFVQYIYALCISDICAEVSFLLRKLICNRFDDDIIHETRTRALIKIYIFYYNHYYYHSIVKKEKQKTKNSIKRKM